ncbi:Prenyl transferase [Durusdinium trenchii]|uniref:Prenyl transferase n=1 Tax=Durusdinium trenchii TaxID=1381693 RepID=A0ABP0KYR3_9DINO
MENLRLQRIQTLELHQESLVEQTTWATATSSVSGEDARRTLQSLEQSVAELQASVVAKKDLLEETRERSQKGQRYIQALQQQQLQLISQADERVLRNPRRFYETRRGFRQMADRLALPEAHLEPERPMLATAMPGRHGIVTALNLVAPAERPSKPSMDYPPPAASIAWPRYLSWLGFTVGALQGLRRKLFGGAQAVALDPALPLAVRLQLINSRRDLRSKAQLAPRSFRQMLRNSADTLEEVPALLVTVAVLAGNMLAPKKGLTGFRQLGEAEALLFTAGKLHLGMQPETSGKMRLLGGDFLYAEGQWMLAELGSLPVIRLTSRMIQDVSDGSSKGGAAPADMETFSVGQVGAKAALHAAYIRVGSYFSAVASGAAWLSGSPKPVVKALRRYGTNLGTALQLAQFREDAASQDAALWLARSAQEALRGPEMAQLQGSAALKGIRRLCHRVERSCAGALEELLRKPENSEIKGLTFADVESMERMLEELYVRPDESGGGRTFELEGMGFRRDQASDDGLQALIARGLAQDALPEPQEPAPSWPPQGPKAGLQVTSTCVGQELVAVNSNLDGERLARPASSDLVREEVVRLFQSGGKRLRPVLTLLTARATGASEAAMADVVSLAAAVEVLHSASLVHDDILDEADTRRGEEAAHVRLGERAAALVGDFLFATASVLVAEIGSLPTVLLISKVVADFGRGELAQSAVRFEAVDYSLEDYLAKSFYKTASLLAAACHAAAVLSRPQSSPDAQECQNCYRFGAYVGLAFQVVDDILDFVATEEELGKPALADLKEGNLGAPVLFAAQEGALPPAHRQELLEAIERRLTKPGDLDLVRRLVEEGKGVEKSKALARRFVDLAALELDKLEPGEARAGMRLFAEYVVAKPKPAVLSNERNAEIYMARSEPGSRDGWMRHPITGKVELWEDHWQTPKCIQQYYQPGTIQLRCPGEPPRWMYADGDF